MSFYRTYYYPYQKECFKHLYFWRDREVVKKKSTTEDNVDAIIDELKEKSKMDESLSRSRRTIRDLILCNPFDYFCTFTFNPDTLNRFDYDACKRRITQLFNNYKKRYSSGFRYLIVPEFHSDGAIHFHGLLRGILPEDLTVPEYIYSRDKRTGNLKKIKNKKQYVDWPYYSKKLGFFSCSKIKHYEACAKYVSKYVTKDLIKLGLGSRLFMASSGLTRPELIFDCDDVPCMFDDPSYQNDFLKIKESSYHYGVVPDYWSDIGSCSELRDPFSSNLQYESLTSEDDIFFPRLTGYQLRMK